MRRKLSMTGLNLIKSFEGCSLHAYKCTPSERFYTIGYGHYGSDVSKNMTISQEKAEKLLEQDCEKFVNYVNGYMDNYNFNQNQFDALVSFAYNIGSINQLTKNGTRSIKEISLKIPEYCKSNGKILNELVARRNREKLLFDTPYNNKSVTDIAKEVISGKWGNGEERKRKLANAGYDYATIQKEVSKLFKVKE